ncbi:MAG: hypothetical protein ACKVQQ_20030 [Burkholderiales bacterium]
MTISGTVVSEPAIFDRELTGLVPSREYSVLVAEESATIKRKATALESDPRSIAIRNARTDEFESFDAHAPSAHDPDGLGFRRLSGGNQAHSSTNGADNECVARPDRGVSQVVAGIDFDEITITGLQRR